MSLNDMQMRSILRLTSHPEWNAFIQYLEYLEGQSLNSLKSSTAMPVVHQRQGELKIIDKIRNIGIDMRRAVEEDNNG